MKLYEKIIDGKPHCKPANKIVIVKDGMQTFNPTEEMLLADGWKEYVPAEDILSDDYILHKEKEAILDEIIKYDSLDEINGFYIGDQHMWIDKATRVGLKLRFDAEIASGKTETVLWYNGVQFPLDLTSAIQMLNAIELYASACYDNTQAHIANVKALEDVEAIENYDYRIGYPEKLRF